MVFEIPIPLGGKVDDRIFPVKMEVDYVRVYQAEKYAKP